MRVAIDPSGRLVVPKALRDARGVGRGGHLEMEFDGSEVRVRSVGFGHLARDDLGLLASPPTEHFHLTPEGMLFISHHGAG